MDTPLAIFDEQHSSFEEKALRVFAYQYAEVEIYRQYCDLLKKTPATIKKLEEIPFLPISFFKNHKVVNPKKQIEQIFESSTTTSTTPSKHFIVDTSLYEHSFRKGFEQFYGLPKNYAILGLLPSYLERGASSLVYMVHDFIKSSPYAESGFFLDDFSLLKSTLENLERRNIPTLLIGVSYALLDFATSHPMALKNTIAMETGGMKGKRKELTKNEVHQILCKNFGLEKIHSEYGMTELLSQAYSRGDGIFETPHWMKVLVRDMYAPTLLAEPGKTGGINVIDLANYHSCSFIETSDMGRVFEDGKFEILGRLQSAEVRGCNLMYQE